MKKLRLNKETVSQLNQMEMDKVKGGNLCLISCANGTRKGKSCCIRDPHDPPILIAGN